MEHPLVTVAVLSHDRRDELARTLQVLRDELDWPADRLEVVVVDNASSDGTPEMLRERFPGVQLVESGANRGVSAWNLAFRAGRGDWFLVLDDDCYVRGGALRDALRTAGDEDADLVSFAVESGTHPGYRFDRHYRTGLLSFWGCAALVSRRALERAGGYDEAIFLWAHEPEFTLRVLDGGLRHAFCPEVVAVHQKGPPGGAPSAFFTRTNSRNLAYIAARHLRAADAARVLPRLLLRAALKAAADRTQAGGVPAVARGALAGLRRRRPARREVSALYRDGFVDFAPPLRFVPPPRELRAALRDPALADRSVGALLQRFWDARPELYPDGPAALRV